MFNFTTTTFIHSADQACKPTGTTDVVKIDNKLIRVSDIVAAYKKASVAAANGKLTVTAVPAAPAAGTEPTKYRLKFYVQRSGDANSLYANDFVFKGKEFVYEWKNDKVNDVEGLMKLIKKVNKLYGDVYLKVDVDNGVIESDNYGSFVEARLQQFEPASCSGCGYDGYWKDLEVIDVETAFDDPADPKSKSSASLKSEFAVNGTGTYEQLIKDLRLPTMENLNWTSLTKMQNELPIPGHKYAQYTIHMVAPRTGLAHQAIEGLQQSKTTHVFFVDEDVASDFETNTGLTFESNLTAVAPQRANFESLHHKVDGADTTTKVSNA